MKRIEKLVTELEADPSIDTIMPAVAELTTLYQKVERSDYAALSDLILRVDDVAADIDDVAFAISSMQVLSVARLYFAAPTDDLFQRACRAWARECVRQGLEFSVGNVRMLRNVFDARDDVRRLYVEEPPLDDVEPLLLVQEEKDDLDEIIEEARKHPRWPDIAAIVAVAKNRAPF